MSTQEKELLLQELNQKAEQISGHALYQAQRRDAQDIGEFIAGEVIDLVEICVDIKFQKYVAKKVMTLLNSFVPINSKTYIRKYFEIYDAVG